MTRVFRGLFRNHSVKLSPESAGKLLSPLMPIRDNTLLPAPLSMMAFESAGNMAAALLRPCMFPNMRSLIGRPWAS